MDINATNMNPTPSIQKLEVSNKAKNTKPTTVDENVLHETIKDDETLPVQEKEKTEEITKEQAEEITKNINKMVKLVSGKLEFTVHEGTKRIMIRVVDTQTNEVIREIPPEMVLNANAKFREVLHLIGILMDEKV